MKRVLLATLGFCLTAGMVWGASGTIRNSAHDLSSSNTTYSRLSGEQHYADSFDRICAYCHTPHKGDTTVDNAPLWNRTNPTDATINAYTFYTSSTLTAAAAGHAAAVDSDLPLCMSCHDGSSLTGTLKNPVKGLTAGTNLAEIGTSSTGLLLDDTNSLTNDHPIGFVYTAAEGDADETGLHPMADAETAGAAFFGSSGNEVWCSSCHAVHSPGTPGGGDEPFLRVVNNASSLCLACHNK